MTVHFARPVPCPRGSDAAAAAKIESPHYFAGGGPAVLHALLFPWWGKRGEVCPENGIWGIPELHAGNAEGSHGLTSCSGKHTLRDVHAIIPRLDHRSTHSFTQGTGGLAKACCPLTTPRTGIPIPCLCFKGCEQMLRSKMLRQLHYAGLVSKQAHQACYAASEVVCL